MCLDGELISAYIDGEITAEELIHVEDHIADCSECRTKVEKYRAISGSIRAHDVPELERRMESVHSRLMQYTSIRKDIDFWKRRIAVPVPLMAAAAACFLFISGFWLFSVIDGNSAYLNGKLHTQQEQFSSGQLDFPTADVQSIDEILRYLAGHSSSVEVTIQLPSIPSLSVSGEPQFLKAVEYRKQ